MAPITADTIANEKSITFPTTPYKSDGTIPADLDIA